MNGTVSSRHGWSDGGRVEADGGIEVQVRGVCACEQHKRCDSSGRCLMLFEGGGSWGEERILARLMKAAGKAMPRTWKDGYHWRRHSLATYKAKEEAMDGFRRECFLRCKPVSVEVRER